MGRKIHVLLLRTKVLPQFINFIYVFVFSRSRESHKGKDGHSIEYLGDVILVGSHKGKDSHNSGHQRDVKYNEMY